MIRQQHPQLFEFERISSENFAYIPLCVRFHLDRTGLRISLDDWQQLPLDDRIALSSYRVDDSAPIDNRSAAGRQAVPGTAGDGDVPAASNVPIAPNAPMTSHSMGVAPAERAADDFAVQLSAWMQAHNGHLPESSAPPTSLPGDALDRIADGVLAQCEWAALKPIELSDWQQLSRFQRYALAKLSRKPKANHDFIPAMKEFGLA